MQPTLLFPFSNSSFQFSSFQILPADTVRTVRNVYVSFEMKFWHQKHDPLCKTCHTFQFFFHRSSMCFQFRMQNTLFQHDKLIYA